MTEPGLALKSAAGRGVLAATILGSGMAMLDGTVVNVALPRIGGDLDAGLTALQWTVNAYTLTLAGFLLLGGSLGDHLGRRRIYVVGVVWFTVASIGCAVAPTAGLLIAMRLLQGVGAALLTPGSLAIIESVFRRDDRAAAVGSWSGLGGVATAVGPVVGGVLVGVAPWGWRLVFLLNVPLAAAVVWLAVRYVPELRDDDAEPHYDVPGVVLAAAGLALTVLALTDGPTRGWPVGIIVLLIVGVVLLAAFVVVEARSRHPMMPLSLFADRQFVAANAVTFVMYAALGGSLFLIPVQLQRVSGFTPVAAGSALLPMTFVMLLLSSRAGRLAARIGARGPMTVGPIVAGLGLVLLVRVGEHASYATDVLPAVVVFALGLSATVAPLTATALAAAPPRQVGVASAVNNDIARVAGLLAVAVLPGLAGITPAAYDRPAELSAGFHHAVVVAGVLCAVGGVLSFVLLARAGVPGPPPAGTPAGTEPSRDAARCPLDAPHHH
ncbi:drug resistance transporter, EmrB/QacA subfamily [Jatrophihabitans endophyticus]|uniref:Drug resistance transporter, EmrB/QacA subfamily n=1 Tax=Jatrophihabitans endophyticus TaxID=1206085 RepID=A0A1M5HIK2_9ACTN|nr:MFS transporter [Jatrophihabitans endophyticus]SHG15731.1 drug resistance transporter, EmrB/QacA subfamily [Jatrophihabitans endophyticus]